MTTTPNTATETVAGHRPTTTPRRRYRRPALLAVAALVALAAAVSLTVWALSGNTSARSHPTRQTAVASAPVTGTAPLPGEQSGSHRVPAYTQFCDNNSDLCVTPKATVGSAATRAYLQFCDNNSDLCVVAPQRMP